MSLCLQNIIDHLNFSDVDIFHDCQRLFHGRGQFYEGLEHVNIDWLPPVLVISVYRPVQDEDLKQLASALIQQIPNCRSVQVQKRYLPKSPFEILAGEEITETVVSEHGLKFHVQLGNAQNTGLFLDTANVRRWVQQHAAGKNILNLFAYTCGFSMAALAGGASQVVNIDNNKNVLRRGKENHRLNALDTELIILESVDIFRSYSRLKKYGPYDLLICDPPTFQKGSVNIERDYRKIMRRIPEFMRPGSQLLLCLNAPNLSSKFLQQEVAEHCPDCSYVKRLHNPPAFREVDAEQGLKALLYHYGGELSTKK